MKTTRKPKKPKPSTKRPPYWVPDPTWPLAVPSGKIM